MDPIASDVGHGALGLRSGLRTMDVLRQSSASQRHAFAELRGAKLLAAGSWVVHSGSIYKISVDETFNNRRLDVISVRRAAETLTRVDAVADVVAGTYFFDPDGTAAGYLYLQLSDSSNPNGLAVLAIFGFYFGSHAVVQPTLGPEKMVDGALDLWASASALTNYTTAGASGASGASLNRDSAIVAEGTYSARLEGTIVPAGFFPLYPNASCVTVVGAWYRFTGLYRTDAANPANVIAQLRVNTGTADISSDGRSTVATGSGAMTLASTGGEWRRFTFDFRADSTTSLPLILLSAAGASGAGKLWVDGLSMRRIYRFEQHHPRISYDALPAITEGRRTIFYDRWQLGQGSLSLDNSDGYFEDLFGTYDFLNATAYVRIGGRFQGGGNEILTEDQWVRRWFMRKGPGTDTRVTISLDDARQIFNEKLPRKFRSKDDSPDLFANDSGRARPIILGSKDATRTGFIKMARLAKTVGNSIVPGAGDGIYEWCDPDFVVQAASDAYTFDAWLYPDEQSATKRDQSAAVMLTTPYAQAGPAVSIHEPGGPILGAGRCFVGGNYYVIRVETGKNDTLDFDEGGGALVATIAAGYYTHVSLMVAAQAALQAAGAGTYTVAYSPALYPTTKVKVTKTAGTLNLRLAGTSANRGRSAWPLLGFTDTADKTGALNYTADTQTFVDCDTQAILRVNMGGLLDDGSGTYTGSAAANIEKAGDVLAFLLRKAFAVPVDQVDLAALATVRSSADALFLYIGAPGEVLEFGAIVERIENSNGIELLMDGDRWTFRKRDSTTPAGITELFDRDIKDDFTWWYDESDLSSTVIVQADQDPGTGKFPATTYTETNNTLCAEARARLGHEKSITFPTYLRSGTLPTYVNELIANATARRRRFKFTVMSACLKKLPGDKLKISRTKFLGRTVAAPSVVVRILNVVHNLQTWESTLECAEVLTGTNQW